MSLFEKKPKEYILLPCKARALCEPLTKEDKDELKGLLFKRENLENGGDILYLQDAKRIAALRYRIKTYGCE